MRDTQQSKVYSAESRWAHLLRDDGWGDVEESVSWQKALGIVHLAADHFGTKRPTVYHRPRNGASGTAWPSGRIVFRSGAPALSTVLHEVAHLVQYSRQRLRGHGGSYTEAHIDVVRWWLDDHAADRLEGVYRWRKITVGVDEEQEHVEQAKAAAAKRRDRTGETGTVYLLAVERGPSKYYKATVSFFERDEWRGYSWPDHATVWRRRSTAEKYKAKLEKRPFVRQLKVDVLEADGVYETRGRARTPTWQLQRDEADRLDSWRLKRITELREEIDEEGDQQ